MRTGAAIRIAKTISSNDAARARDSTGADPDAEARISRVAAGPVAWRKREAVVNARYLEVILGSGDAV